MYRFRAFAEWREFAVVGALQSLEINQLCAAPQRTPSLPRRKCRRMAMENRHIGKSVPRKEGREKVTGTARYVDDLTFPEMIHGVTVRSSVARGKILGIQFGEGILWNEFTIVTAMDILGKNCIALLIEDQPCLADQFVNHPEEAVVLLAHADKYLLEEARRAVHIEVEPLPAIFTIDDSLARKEIIWGDDNIFKSYRVEKGDVASTWSGADFIVEGEYETGAQEQLYIEPQGMIARANSADGVTVWGSLQCPYYVHKALVRLFGLPKEKVRVVQTETGGGFGGKEEYPSMIAGHAALLALKSGKPVKMIYDRAEDMAATTKRHPSRTRHRTAVSKEGKLLGGEIDFAIDGGAYMTLSPVVLSRGTIHAPGPYHWPYLTVRAKAVATNIPPHGAFRGFGAPQSIFALERHMDKIAKVVGLTPEELRRRNFLTTGDRTATGQLLSDPVDMQHLLTRALKESNYHAKRAHFEKENPTSTIKRGIGFATFFHGAGFTGSGERRLNSLVEIKLDRQTGRPLILVSSTEFGQGTNTILCQVAAQTLGLPYEEVGIAQPDTHLVPNSGPTVASRTAMIVGKLIERASTQILSKLGS